MALRERAYTAAEFCQLAETFADDRRYELVNGHIVEENLEIEPPRRVNAWVAGTSVYYMRAYAEESKNGNVYGADGGYTLDESNVRIPDASFVSKERLAGIGDVTEILAPDLAVEVISPNETPRKVHEKTELYLNSGSKLVWNAYPDEQIVEVWRTGTGGTLQMRKLTVADTLDGEDGMRQTGERPVRRLRRDVMRGWS